MKFLGVTETCDLGSLYLRLQEEGHEVRVSVSEPLAQGTMAGLVPHVPDWQSALDWVGRDGVVIFEAVSEGFGARQDELRAQGFRVIGGSAFGDRLENDRAFALALLADLGFPAGHVREFHDAGEGDAYIAGRPRRYVLKFCGPGFASSDNYIGQLPDGRDVRAMLRARADRLAGSRFILMDFIDGVEMGVGAYFDGSRLLTPACLDWEHKRFFAGDLGELTGEMGTVATFDRSSSFFARTLALIEPHLRAAGHVGYVNLNTIVNEDGIWPIEFTCRFGYPGFAVLQPLQATPWGELFDAMTGGGGGFAATPGFSTGIVLSTPPFPYSRKEIDEPVGLPIFHDKEDREHVHLGEAGCVDGQLVTSGLYGWTAVVTGTDCDLQASIYAAYERIRRILVPNGRYRLDIGQKLLNGDYARVEALGLLD